MRNVGKTLLAMVFIAGGACNSGGPDGSRGLGNESNGQGNGGSAGQGTGGNAGTQGTADGTMPPAGPPKLSDPQVVAILKTANQGEVDQAKAALSCVQKPDVVAFAQKMITDHSAALARVEALMANVGSADSPENAALMNVGKQQVALIKSDSSSGSCDEVYVKVQVTAHSTVMALFDEVLVPSAQSADVKAEVQMEQSAVEMHLEDARKLETELGLASDVPPAGKVCDGAKLSEGQVIKWLMVSNKGEVDDGQMVLGKAVVPDARAFAQRMITDHGAALTRVEALSARLGIAPQESRESMEKEIEGMVNDQILEMLFPPAFDLAYIDIEVLDHVSDLDSIDQDLIPSTCTPELKAEVEAERATVATHQGLARDAEPRVRAAAGQ